MSKARPPKAMGTYGFLDVLRHPSRVFAPPKASEGSSDIEAVRGGEARRISCFLRGSVDPFPRKLKQGRLQLSHGVADWTPFSSLSRNPVALRFTIQEVSTRPADFREPNVKRGGTVLGVVAVPAFVVVSCAGSLGTVDLIVPSADGPLVYSYFKDRLHWA